MSNPQPESTNRYIRPVLITVIGLTLISGLTIFFTFTQGLYRPPSLPETPIVIQGAQVFDGDSLLPGTPTVVIEGEAIACLGKGCEVPAEAQVIDGTGLTLMPGLIDGYVRFYAPTQENLSQGELSGFLSYVKQRPDVRRNLLAAGVTSVFSAGDLPQNILLLKEQQAEGEMAGPRLLCAGPDFTAPDGFPQKPLYAGNETLEEEGVRTQTDPAAAQQEAAKLLSYGLDAVKLVYDDLDGRVPKLDAKVMKAVIQVAASEGSYAVVRCGSNEDLRTAVQAGARVVAYGPAAPLDSSTIALLAQESVVYYPLMASRSRADLPRLRENVAALRAAGVSVGLGSAPNGESMQFGESLLREVELQAGSGRAPLELLQQLTRAAARSLRIDDRTGHLAEGLQADLVLLRGNPLEDLDALGAVQWVLQGGRIMVADGELQD